MLVVYDVTNESSFSSVNRWIQHVKELKPDVPLGVVGNKCDLVDDRKVAKETAEAYCAERKVDFFEASALDGQGVAQAFEQFVKRMFNERPSDKPKEDVVSPSKAPKPAKSGGMCLV